MLILFSSRFRCLSKFVFKCSVIQQRNRSSSRSTCSLDFKLTGIQTATKAMLDTTNREHRKLIGVKMMSLFGGIQFLLSGVCQFFKIWVATYRKYCLMCCPTNKVIKSLYSEALAPTVVPYQAFTTVLCSYRVVVLERRCGETFGLASYRKYPPNL